MRWVPNANPVSSGIWGLSDSLTVFSWENSLFSLLCSEDPVPPRCNPYPAVLEVFPGGRGEDRSAPASQVPGELVIGSSLIPTKPG